MSKPSAGSKWTDPNRTVETHIIEKFAADVSAIAAKKEHHEQLCTSKNIKSLALL